MVVRERDHPDSTDVNMPGIREPLHELNQYALNLDLSGYEYSCMAFFKARSTASGNLPKRGISGKKLDDFSTIAMSLSPRETGWEKKINVRSILGHKLSR